MFSRANNKAGIFFFSLCLLAIAVSIRAGVSTSATGMAMAGAYRSLAVGAEAPFFNPANLAWCDSNRLGVHFLGISVWAHNNAFSKRDYTQYNGAHLDEADKEKILRAIPAAGLVLRGGAAVQPLSVRYGPLAFSTNLIAAAKGAIAEDIFSLLLYGNALDYEYHFKPAAAEAIVFTNYALSGAKSFSLQKSYLRRLAVGVNLKYLRGHFYGQSEDLQARALTEFTSVRGDGSAQIRYARGGDGFSLDLGCSGEITDRWRAAITVENIGGRIRWHRGTEMLHSDFSLDATNVDEIFEQETDWEDVVVHHDTTYEVAAFTTKMPVALHFGSSYRHGNLSVAAEYGIGLRESALTTRRGRMALGGEYRLWRFLPLRLGLAVGGESGFLFSYGMGLRIKAFRWNLGAQQVGGVLPAYARGLGLALSFSLDF